MLIGSRKVVQFKDLDYILHQSESLPHHSHTIQSIKSKGTLTFVGILGLYLAANLSSQILFPKLMGGLNAKRIILDLIMGLLAGGLAIKFSFDTINEDVKKIKRDLVLSYDPGFLCVIRDT